jgi:HEAT repeat protein
MLELRRSGLGLVLGFALLVLNAFASWNSASPDKSTRAREISRHISILKAGGAQQKAAAAYWLGQQHFAAAPAIDPLVELLGDTRPVDAGQYRSTRIVAKLTLGEEAAAALVNIGHPSIEALIRVLKTSPDAEARKNAAWALGALHDSGATSQI